MSETAGLCEIFFSRSGFWTFIFCLFLVWTPVKGGLHLIGSSQPIVAAPGDDVILPCRVDPEWDAVGKTVEWSRPDLRPTGPQKRVEYVFVYRFRKTDRDMMMDTYIQRTSLSQDGLRRGDVSLTIRNVSLQDQGRFRCFIPRLGVEAELLLVVDPNFVSTTTETVSHRNLITLTPQEETSRNGESAGPNSDSLGSDKFYFVLRFFDIFLLLFQVIGPGCFFLSPSFSSSFL
uniref:Ig-like domain-containing protein n=1 Tax=Poecilia formosa TaxID=48698 RepID=A0A096LRY2_POEFO